MTLAAPRLKLFTDAEPREDASEHVVGRDLAEDRAQGIQRLAKLGGDELGAVGEALAGPRQRRLGVVDRVNVTGVQRERACASRAERELVEPPRQCVHVLARVRADTDCGHKGVTSLYDRAAVIKGRAPF